MKQVIEGLEEGLNAIAEAVQGGAIPLPTPTTADRGKFLGVNASNNNIGWKEIDVNALPEQSESTDGMFLRSEFDGISGESEAAWANIKQVPSAIAANAGDVLTADGEGTYDWAAPSGGGSLPSYTSDDIGKYLGIGRSNDNPVLKWARITNPVYYVQYTQSIQKSAFTTDGDYVYYTFVGAGEPNANIDYTVFGFGTTGAPFNYCVESHSVGQNYDDNSGNVRVYFNKADFDMIDSTANITMRVIMYTFQ